VAKLSTMHEGITEAPAGLLDELLGGTWTTPDDEDYPHEAVEQMQALLDELVADLCRC